MQLHKWGSSVQISDELLFQGRSAVDRRFERRANVTKTEPTEEAWARYRAAVEALKVLEEYEGTEWGGPDYDTVVNEPEADVTFEYLETHEEWLDRCRRLLNDATPDTPPPTHP